MKAKKPVQPKLRLSPDLHKRLLQAAKQSGRSLNSEMVRRLEQSFEQRRLVLNPGDSKELSAAILELFAKVPADPELGKAIAKAPKATPAQELPLIEFTYDEDEK